MPLRTRGRAGGVAGSGMGRLDSSTKRKTAPEMPRKMDETGSVYCSGRGSANASEIAVLSTLNAGQGGVDKLHCGSHEEGYDGPSDKDHERIAENANVVEGVG